MNFLKRFVYNIGDTLSELVVIAVIIALGYGLLRGFVLFFTWGMQHDWATLDVFLAVVIFAIITALVRTVFWGNEKVTKDEQ